MNLKLFLLSSIFLILLNLSFGFAEFICPPPKSIRPCDCSISKEEGNSFGRGRLVCDGPRIGQDSIWKSIQTIRSVNGLSSSDWLDLSSIDIQYTEMKTLDLSSFFRTKVDLLSIFGNLYLDTLQVSSTGFKVNEEQIDATALTIAYNKINDQSFGSIFNRFSPSLTQADLNNNEITGGQYPRRNSERDNEIEFLPGLSALSNLKRLNLNGNQIKKVEGGQFKRNQKLIYLSLIDNQLEMVGPKAFDGIQEPNEDNASLDLFLASNLVNENSFSNRSGIAEKNGRVNLDLRDNEFSTLPRETFEPFLEKNGGNSLTAFRNRFVCDVRMKYLKDRRTEWEERVTGVVCKNEPGRNVFNSDLIQKF